MTAMLELEAAATGTELDATPLAELEADAPELTGPDLCEIEIGDDLYRACVMPSGKVFIDMTVGEFLAVPLSVAQNAAQRPAKRRYREFDSRGFGIPLVGLEAFNDGNAARYNGNGRVQTFLDQGDITGDTMITVEVVEVQGLHDARRVWQASNTSMTVTSAQANKVDIVTGEEATMAAVDLALMNGFTLGPAKSPGKITGPAAKKIYANPNADEVYRVIKAVSRANREGAVNALCDAFAVQSPAMASRLADTLIKVLEVSEQGSGGKLKAEVLASVQAVIANL